MSPVSITDGPADATGAQHRVDDLDLSRAPSCAQPVIHVAQQALYEVARCRRQPHLRAQAHIR